MSTDSRSEIVLYQYPGDATLPSISPPCLKVQLALRKLGLEHEIVDLNPLQAGRHSPTGRLPALRIGPDRTVADSMAILDLLEELHPGRAPFGATGAERTRDRLLEHLVEDTLYWRGLSLRWVVPEHRARLIDYLLPRPSPIKLFVRWVYAPSLVRRARAQGCGRHSPTEMEARFEEVLDLFQDSLEGGPFLQGRSEPGRADLAAAALLAQVCVADAQPRVEGLVRQRRELTGMVGRVLDEAGIATPLAEAS
ncbi:MAG: glutathione S-transferase N-terminal domain-containing protein [Acidobacteriota bacterium]